MPEYARDGRALGALVPVDVRGAQEVGERFKTMLGGLADGRPEGVEAITDALNGAGLVLTTLTTHDPRSPAEPSGAAPVCRTASVTFGQSAAAKSPDGIVESKFDACVC